MDDTQWFPHPLDCECLPCHTVRQTGTPNPFDSREFDAWANDPDRTTRRDTFNRGE